jgi:hypothetical protein
MLSLLYFMLNYCNGLRASTCTRLVYQYAAVLERQLKTDLPGRLKHYHPIYYKWLVERSMSCGYCFSRSCKGRRLSGLYVHDQRLPTICEGDRHHLQVTVDDRAVVQADQAQLPAEVFLWIVS